MRGSTFSPSSTHFQQSVGGARSTEKHSLSALRQKSKGMCPSLDQDATSRANQLKGELVIFSSANNFHFFQLEQLSFCLKPRDIKRFRKVQIHLHVTDLADRAGFNHCFHLSAWGCVGKFEDDVG